MYDVCVVGLGKLGLPLSVYYANKGANVIGVDINQELVSQINEGSNPILNEKNLTKDLNEAISNGKLSATNDYEKAIPNSKVIIVVVPLFTNELGDPDFSLIDSAVDSIAKNLSKGSLIIFETTLPVGTTSDRIAKRLVLGSNLTIESDFFLAFSPERVLTGRVFEDLEKYPKIVGGYGEESGRRAFNFYSKYIRFAAREDLETPNGVWIMQNSSSAEFVKLAETTYRDVNIALANTFSIYAYEKEIDIHEVIRAANSQMHSHIHDPGISVGGHCIPVYPNLYLSGHANAKLVRTAREVNQRMPIEYIGRLRKRTGLKGKNILIYGLAYRPDVKESYLSGTFDLAKELVTQEARVVVYDPLYTKSEIVSAGLEAFDATNSSKIDIMIVHTKHQEIENFVDMHSWDNLETVLLGRSIDNLDLFSEINKSILFL